MTASAAAPGSPAGATSSSLYDVRPTEPDGAHEQVYEVWREGGLGQTLTPESTRQRYDWFYIQNPQGTACLNLLYGNDGSLVGSLGVGARQVFIDGAAHRGGVLVDFVVSPRHRSVLPALTLQRKGREAALGTMDLLYGLPSPKAASVCKRLETQVAFELPRFARVLRFRAYMQRVLPAWLALPASWVVDALDRIRIGARLFSSSNYAEWASDFDETFDTLWDAVDKRGQCIGLRNREFLRWRFGKQPGHTFDVLAIRSRRDGSLRAYFVCDRNGEALSVADCLSIGSEDELVQSLLLLGLKARKLGMASVNLRLTGLPAWSRALLRAGFRVRSSQIFFAVMNPSLAAKVAPYPWHLTRADEDV